MIMMLRSCAICRSGFRSTVRPYRWTGMIAFVRGVIAAATAAASMFIVRSSTSTRMGRAFAYRIASTVAKNVCDTVMPSSPAETPHARMASCSASVPLPTPTLCFVPMYAANSWSNAFTFGPIVSCMLSRTSSIARRTSSRIVRYCAFRSTRGISCVATAAEVIVPSPSSLGFLGKVLEPRVGVGVDADEAREIADVVLELDRGIARPHRTRRHFVPHDAARADERVLADLGAGQDRAVRSDAGAPADDAALDAVEVGRALGMRIVREHDVRSEKHVVVDLRQLEEASGMDAHPRADAVAELERRVCPHRDVVADHVVLADRGALAGLQARADPRPGVDRGEGTDDGARADDELELALLLASRRAPEHDVFTDDAAFAQAHVRADDRGRVDRRRRARAHARTTSRRYATRAPPERSDRMASSSTRTTWRPASPSLRGFAPSRTQSMKWRISTCSASVIGTRGLWMSPAR